MFSTFTATVIMAISMAQDSGPEGACARWSIDKDTVMVGGCLTIVVEDACREMGGLTLTIDDRSPVPLLERAGITIQYTTGPGPGVTHTFILISHDFANPEGMELIAKDPVTYRMVPVFNEPGRVRLALESEHGSLGNKVVTVTPLAPEAKPAVDLLYPVIVRKDGAGPRSVRVVELLSRSPSGGGAAVTRESLEHLYDDLTILRKHADWAEIFEMLVARAEAWMRVRELSEALRNAGGNLENRPKRAAVSERVLKAMEADIKGPFARAVQDSLKNMVALPEFLPDGDAGAPRTHDR